MAVSPAPDERARNGSVGATTPYPTASTNMVSARTIAETVPPRTGAMAGAVPAATVVSIAAVDSAPRGPGAPSGRGDTPARAESLGDTDSVVRASLGMATRWKRDSGARRQLGERLAECVEQLVDLGFVDRERRGDA